MNEGNDLFSKLQQNIQKGRSAAYQVQSEVSHTKSQVDQVKGTKDKKGTSSDAPAGVDGADPAAKAGQNPQAGQHPAHAGGRPGAPMVGMRDERVMHALKNQFQDAVTYIKKAPHLSRVKNPVYHIPWVLMLGRDHQKMDHFLTHAAEDLSPFPPLDKAELMGHSSMHFWYFHHNVLLEPSADLLNANSHQPSWLVWQEIFTLLKKYRGRYPLNGAVLLLDAEELLDAQSLQSKLIEWRGLLDEAYRQMQWRFPVHIVITGMDNVQGFKTFSNYLPDEAMMQVLGFRFDESMVHAGDIEAQFKSQMQALQQRFYAICHDIKLDQDTGGKDALSYDQFAHMQDGFDVFEFPFAFGQLQDSMKIVARCLFGENPYQYRTFPRGVYFMSHHEGHIHFMRDLFELFLPMDLSLAERL